MSGSIPINMLDISILIPLLGAILALVTGSRPNLRETVILTTSVTLFAVVLIIYQQHDHTQVLFTRWIEIIPGLSLSFSSNYLGLMFALLAAFLWIVTTVYSIGYMRSHHEKNQTRFYVCFAVAISSVMAIAFADNLFTLFVFYEVLTLSTYPLVTHAGDDKARKGGRVYLNLLLGTSIMLFLLAIIGTWLITGTLDFTEGGIFTDEGASSLTGLLLFLYIFGVGKAALIPFHGWLPSAMVAPTPVSALLHAVAVVKAGVFTILKISMFIFGPDLLHELVATQWLLYITGTSVLFASIMALRQDNLKARLAYSTVGQLGYITLGALLATGSAITGASMHIVMHAFGKITLFFCAGAILVSQHKTEISDMRGLGRKMPLTMIAFFIGSLCIIGLPPTGGTWSKWHLIKGTFQADQLVLTMVLVASSLLSIAYLIPISIRAFFPLKQGSRIEFSTREAPLASLLALGVTSLGCILLFFFPQAVYELATNVSGSK